MPALARGAMPLAARAWISSCPDSRSRTSRDGGRSSAVDDPAETHSREVQERKACEQGQKRTNAAPRPVVISPVRPVLVGCRVVRRVATAQEPAEDQEHRKRDAGQSWEPLPRRWESVSRRVASTCADSGRIVMSTFGRREDGYIPSKCPNGGVDPERQLPQELRDYEDVHRAGWIRQVEEHAYVPNQEEWPPDQPEPGHAARDEAGAVHQVAEDQPVPEGDDESGAKQKRPVLARRPRRRGRPRPESPGAG